MLGVATPNQEERVSEDGRCYPWTADEIKTVTGIINASYRGSSIKVEISEHNRHQAPYRPDSKQGMNRLS